MDERLGIGQSLLSSDGKARIKSKLLLSKPPSLQSCSAISALHHFTFHFTFAGIPGLTSFRKATDPEHTRDSTDMEAIILSGRQFGRTGAHGRLEEAM